MVTGLARIADHVWDLLPAAVFLALVLGGAA